MKRLAYFLISFFALMSCAEKPYVIVQIADAQLGFTAADKSQKEGTEYVNDLPIRPVRLDLQSSRCEHKDL